MSTPRVLALAITGLLAACETGERRAVVEPDGPLFAFTQDLEGTPDLIVNQHRLAVSWVIYEEFLPASFCSVEEAGIAEGVYRTLRFTVMTPNIGDADVFIGDPLAHVDPNGDGDFSDSDGLYELSSCHNHFHFRNYATYEIFPVRADGSVGKAIQAKKRGFCMIDVDPFKSDETPPQSWVYRSCGTITRHGNQGVSTGWADTYFKWLGGQYFLLDDPKEPIRPGEYVIRITVNPPFKPRGGEPCPALDPSGFCHMFVESNYDNNVAETRVSVPDRVGKTGFGPGSGETPPGVEPIDDENRPTVTKS